MSYFGFENMIEWICYITAIIVVMDFDTCNRNTGLRYSWQWQVITLQSPLWRRLYGYIIHNLGCFKILNTYFSDISIILDRRSICDAIMVKSIINASKISVSRDLCCNVHWRSSNISQIFPHNPTIHNSLFPWIPRLAWRAGTFS